MLTFVSLTALLFVWSGDSGSDLKHITLCTVKPKSHSVDYLGKDHVI